jgi:hypothetical protein
MKVYVLDSNFFIQAHRTYYPFDVTVGFWNKIKVLAESGQVISIDKVKDEIYENVDVLSAWCKDNLPADFFKDTSGVIATEYSTVVRWANSRSNHYMPQALNEFLDSKEADAFLVAFVLADLSDRVVVTDEESNVNMKRKIKIPEPCNALGVPFCNAMNMFRQLGETF